MTMRITLLGLIMCSIGVNATTSADDAPAAVIPQPAEIRVLEGSFPLSGEIQIYADGKNAEAVAVGNYFADRLKEQTGLPAKVVTDEAAAMVGAQFLFMLQPNKTALGEEGYELVVTPIKILLSAAKPNGLFLGVQTIRQLVTRKDGAWEMPSVRVKDVPCYPWRGSLLDCSRHFMDKDFVKRYIDLLAYHKMNVLHWHLTDDQGWRIEIKKYPKITEIGSWRGEGDQRYGGFYSQADVKDIVEYAKSRYITVVPEIEMPGHALAALAAYPELSCSGGPFKVETGWGVFDDVYCAGNEKTFEFLQDVLTEVLALFPGEYIHVGGDECPKTRWQACPKCQERIKAEGLKDEKELQSYFIKRIEKFLNEKGRRLIGWDEILEGGLPDKATVQSWRGVKGAVAAAQSGHDVISSPTSNCYLDYAQERIAGEPTFMGFIDLKTCYAFEPTPAELTPEQAYRVLGLEGNIWTEHAPQPRVDWQVFPRLCALAEVAWSPKEQQNWDGFQTRLKTHYARLDELGVKYFIPAPQCPATELVFENESEIQLQNPFGSGAIHYTLDGTEPDAKSPKFAQPLKLSETKLIKARLVLPNERMSNIAEFSFRKLQPQPAADIPDARPGVNYAYYEGFYQQLPDFSKLTPSETGVVETVNIEKHKSVERFAMTFDGFLDVPADGTYTFFLISDDGSKLWIGGELIVDHDGLHGASEKSGQVILKAGKHPFRAAFFQAGGAQHLEINYQGPNLEKRLLPPAALFHSATATEGSKVTK